jgi:hypothetical protein
VAGCCESSDEPSDCGTMELIRCTGTGESEQ